MKYVAMAALALVAAGCTPPAEPPIQGYAEGEYVRVAGPIAGALLRLDVQRGSRVAAGAPLFALESESESAARREAEERQRKALAQLDNLRKGRRESELESVRAQLAQAQAAGSLSVAELKRQEQLVSQGFASRQKLDEARSAVARDRARIDQLKADLSTANLASRPDEIRAAEAEAAAAKAILDQADWRLRQKTVTSVVAGVVTDTLFARGEWVGAGQPVVAILPPENIKARFFVAETHLAQARIGRSVEVRCDGCGAPIQATITYVSPQAEYTPPVIYSKDNRAKLVFLVEARPSTADAERLHPGQPLDVSLR